MATKALGSDRVLAVQMPCGSSKEDLEDAKLVLEKFNVKSITVDLSSTFNLLKKEIDISLGENNLSKEALINVKPRLRMTTLYAVAQTFGYLVIRNRKFI